MTRVKHVTTSVRCFVGTKTSIDIYYYYSYFVDIIVCAIYWKRETNITTIFFLIQFYRFVLSILNVNQIDQNKKKIKNSSSTSVWISCTEKIIRYFYNIPINNVYRRFECIYCIFWLAAAMTLLDKWNVSSC